MSEIEHLTDRSVLRIKGPEAESFLQGLITQDMALVKPGAPQFSALLTPQGKILYDFLILADDDGYLIDCASAATDELLKRLKLYKLRAKVEISALENENVYVAAGPIDDPRAFVDPRSAALGWRMIAPSAAAKATPATASAYSARRIAAGVPEGALDFGPDEVFLLDVNFDAANGVNYKKGCFVGQEVTSRMKRKGEVRKRTLVAQTTAGSFEKGASVTANGAAIGEILNGGGSQALVLARIDRWRKAVADGADLTCDGVAVELATPALIVDH